MITTCPQEHTETWCCGKRVFLENSNLSIFFSFSLFVGLPYLQWPFRVILFTSLESPPFYTFEFYLLQMANRACESVPLYINLQRTDPSQSSLSKQACDSSEMNTMVRFKMWVPWSNSEQMARPFSRRHSSLSLCEQCLLNDLSQKHLLLWGRWTLGVHLALSGVWHGTLDSVCSGPSGHIE